MILPQQTLNPKIKPRWNCSLGMVEAAVRYNCMIHGFPVPVLAMPFWEGAGNKAYDVSGKRNIGTLTNGVKWVGGQSGGALKFDGVNDYVGVPNLGTLEGISNLTVSAWAQSPNWQISGAGWMGIVSQRFPGGQGPFKLDVAASDQGADWGKVGFWIRNSSDVIVNSYSNSVLNVNQWNHLLGVYNGVTVDLYIDGIKQISNPSQSGVTDSGGPGLYFGRQRVVNLEYFNGLIDNVRIYDRALTPAQVKFEYDNPYFMFQPIPVPYVYAAPVGGLSIPVAIHHYQHNIRV